jgi:nucleoid-associated protein YgaU
MLLDKYKELDAVAAKLGLRDYAVKEAGGKLQITGKTTYALERDLFWDALKKHAGWDAEVAADIRADRDDIHGMYTVQAGDSLSKIAKLHLDDVNRYMEIFNANKDTLKDPNMIHPGQQLVIPKR